MVGVVARENLSENASWLLPYLLLEVDRNGLHLKLGLYRRPDLVCIKLPHVTNDQILLW